MRYTLTSEAQQDLLDIEAYISQDNPNAALNVIETLEAAFVLLAANPQLGHRRRDIKTMRPVRFWPVYRHYQVVYLDNTTPLAIIRVISGYRNVPALIDNDVETD
jgi:plasmid stabilization system protein ParE